jgi:hypothetical protein
MTEFKLCKAAGLNVRYDLTIFASEVEALLANAPVVYCTQNGDSLKDNIQTWQDSAFTLYSSKATHTARLILIEPIKKDTAKSLLRELLDNNDGITAYPEDWSNRVCKLLGEGGEG